MEFQSICNEIGWPRFYCATLYVWPSDCRRVHVTDAVVEWLAGDYDVEPGHGANRSEYLYKHNITTYLIKDNQPRMKVIV